MQGGALSFIQLVLCPSNPTSPFEEERQRSVEFCSMAPNDILSLRCIGSLALHNVFARFGKG